MFQHNSSPRFGSLSLLAAAQQINIEPHLKRATMTRYSNRQQRLMNLDGLIGRISLTGDLSAFNELLTLGQQVHLGKNATMGLGQYHLNL